MPASSEVRRDPDTPVRVPYEIYGVTYLTTEEEIQAHMDKVEMLRKVALEEQESKATLIEIVNEEAEAIGLKPQDLVAREGREKLKKAQDAALIALKEKRDAKLKKSAEVRQHNIYRYKWIMTQRLNPEPITDVKIHQNTKPAVLSVFRGQDKRHFEVHDPFKFSDFGITELDELGHIIAKKSNVVVKNLMKSLRTRYDQLAMKHEELGILSLLPASASAIQGALTQSSRRKRKKIEIEPEISAPGLNCNRALLEGVKFVNNWVIEQPERGLFFTDEYGDPAFQRWADIYQAGIKAMHGYFLMANPIRNEANARFCHNLMIKIQEHPNKHELESKRQNLEVLCLKF